MTVDSLLSSLVQYGIKRELIAESDRTFILNQLLDALALHSYTPSEPVNLSLEEILQGILDDAVNREICADDITSRDLLDTKLMGILTPWPHEVRRKFTALYAQSPRMATDWYYRFSQDTDYIRRYRMARDVRWEAETEYGHMVITINQSKPEKDPRAIAAARNAPQSDYPKCQLCAENEGYAGRMNHPPRQNHRIIPVTVAGSEWFFQYSPYVYYNEHCIVFNQEHTPMVIDRETFQKLLSFVTDFPHYFVGSNADLPIVGGSILSHDHFQGGHFVFPMEKASVDKKISFAGYDDIQAGIVKWPLSVIRLTGPDRDRLIDLADKILGCWRGYTDEAAFIFAETEGIPHNTITPIARRRGTDYELDLVLRNNITTEEHPLGVYHPHAELHHIKKENIGLIEVMGLAVLPARLKTELTGLAEALISGAPLTGELEKHAPWAEELKKQYTFTQENAVAILRTEVGKVFAKVLEHSGVFKRDPNGEIAFERFIEAVNQEGTV